MHSFNWAAIRAQCKDSHDRDVICKDSSAQVLGGIWAEFFLADQTKRAAMLHFHHGRFKMHVNDHESQTKET